MSDKEKPPVEWEDAGGCDIRCPECKATFNDEIFFMGRNRMDRTDIQHCPNCGVRISSDALYGKGE